MPRMRAMPLHSPPIPQLREALPDGGSWLDETLAYRDQRELRLIDHVEFLFDVVEMGAHGRRRQFQVLRDFLHCRTPREPYEDLEFSLRELIHGRPAPSVEFRQRQLLRKGRLYVASAGADRAHGLEQGFGRPALREKPECAFLQRATSVHEIIMGGQR